MTLKEQIMADIKSAMKSKEQEKLTTLRFLHAAIKNKEIDIRPDELDDKGVTAVLKTMVKQRKDSIEQYENADRKDLAEKERAELKIMQAYLPEEMSRDQVETIVTEAISEVSASSMKDMGNVMKAVMAKTQGAADNKVVSEIVRAKLQ